MAGVWLHPNRGGGPFRLDLKERIIVYPNDNNPARLPILGLRALVRNDLKLIIDGKHKHVTLKTGWF